MYETEVDVLVGLKRKLEAELEALMQREVLPVRKRLEAVGNALDVLRGTVPSAPVAAPAPSESPARPVAKAPGKAPHKRMALVHYSFDRAALAERAVEAAIDLTGPDRKGAITLTDLMDALAAQGAIPSRKDLAHSEGIVREFLRTSLQKTGLFSYAVAPCAEVAGRRTAVFSPIHTNYKETLGR